MPKNKLFKCQNPFLKNYTFYLFMHFIFKNAFQFQLEIILPNSFSAQNTNKQKTTTRQLQLRP